MVFFSLLSYTTIFDAITARETLIYSRRNAPQGPPGQAREGTL